MSDRFQQLYGIKCIQLRPLSWDQPKAGLKPNYTENPAVWYDYPRVPQRYGVLLEPNNLLVVDIDHPDKIDHNKLKSTFTVKTGGGGYHLYYKLDVDGMTSDYTPDWGELKTTGHVVGPDVMHESGNKYEVVKDISIKNITKKDLVPVCGEDILKDDEDETRNDDNASNTKHDYNKDDPLGFVKSDKIRKDIRDALKSPGAPHNKRVWAVGWMYSVAGLNESEIYNIVSQINRWSDFDRETTKNQIKSVINSSRNGRG